MPMQKIEFEFPEEENDKIELEKSSAVTIDLENPNSHLEKKEEEKPKPEAKKPTKTDDDDDLDLEIVDDTPKADRGRKPSEPPEDPTEEELESYSEKVRNRLKHFTKGYHDERRAKENALREAQEAAALVQKLMEENRNLKANGNRSQTALLTQAKQNAEVAYNQAKAAYKAAYSDGDPDKVLEAQEKLTEARQRVDKLANVKIPTLQEEESGVHNNNTSKPVKQSDNQADATISVDERAAKWAKENPWFHTDVEMTGYALGLHNKLVNEGVDPTSDEYYQTINKNVRRVFPDRFDDVEEKSEKRESASDNVVAPASRSTAPKKVRLTQTQVRLAKRLGLTPEQYAKQVAIEMRKG